MADKVTWFELPAGDMERVAGFYKEVFGWQVSDMGGGSLVVQSGEADESMIPTERGVINGDISPRSQVFDRPLIVIQTDDIKAKLEMVVSAGGQVVLEPQEYPDMGMLWAIFTDSEGSKLGLVQMI